MSAAETVARLIDELLSQGDVRPVEAATKLDATMRSEFPDEHSAYLDSQSRRLYREDIDNAIRRRRGFQGATSKARAFGRAVDAACAGDAAPLSIFIRWKCAVDDDGTQRSIGDMVGADHRFVASTYEASSRTDAMLAQFHSRLAKRCGSRATKDVMGEEDLERLYRSITGHGVDE